MKLYYDRTDPLRIVSEPSFDAIPVTIDPETAELIFELRAALQHLVTIEEGLGAPEDSAQEAASWFENELEIIFAMEKDDAS